MRARVRWMATEPTEPAFAPREALGGKDARTLARELLEMTQEEFSAAFKGSPMKRAALSFAGDDWRRVALAAYRGGSSPAETDPADDALRVRLQNPPPVTCATHILTGADDGVERTPLNPEQLARWFPAGAHSAALRGVGHWPHRESPDAVVEAVLA